MLTNSFCQTHFGKFIKLRLDTKLDLPTYLSKIEISSQSRRGRREVIFLFGGERPQNKKPSSKSEPEQA